MEYDELYHFYHELGHMSLLQDQLKQAELGIARLSCFAANSVTAPKEVALQNGNSFI